MPEHSIFKKRPGKGEPTDRAAELIEKYGIELSELEGTGRRGEILVAEVREYVKEHNLDAEPEPETDEQPSVNVVAEDEDGAAIAEIDIVGVHESRGERAYVLREGQEPIWPRSAAEAIADQQDVAAGEVEIVSITRRDNTAIVTFRT